MPGMHGGAGGDADRRKLAQDHGGARHGGDAVTSRPDVDGDALDAIGTGAHEIVGGPALPGELDAAGPAAQVLPRPVRVADQVREAPQPPGGKAQLRGAQQALARVPGVLLPALLAQHVQAWGGNVVWRGNGANWVGEQA